MEASDIIDSIDIVEYISQYIDLELKQDGEYWGLSCFTDEKTPSFSVNPEKKYFKDFSSGKGGNLVQFVIEHDHVSVSKAINILKAYANISDSGISDKTNTRLEATRIAKKYRRRIKSPPRTTAKILYPDVMSQYIFDKNMLKLWTDEGININTLYKYGVRYDAFDNRIVYPIKDYEGNIISICGRTCNPDYKAKNIRKYTYLHSIGALDTIYGFSDNRDYIIEAKEMIVFEGAKSCLKAYDWGYKNTVALLTSHLSLNQLKFLIKFCNYNNVQIVFALDSDIDISNDENIRKLCSYARVFWLKNRDGLLEPKDSPVDKGKAVFENLYKRREKLEFLCTYK